MSNNKNIVLVMGKPSSGKSASLRNVENKEGCVYFNTDLKELPVPGANRFKGVEITDPKDLLDYIPEIESESSVDLGVIDTLTFLMDMFESQHVINSANTQAAWGNYGQFYKEFVHAIKSGTKDYVVYAHEADKLNTDDCVMETYVPIKGAVGKRGVNQSALLHREM